VEGNQVKPIIGITAFVEDDLSAHLNAAYSKSVIEAGGIPLIIPLGVEEDAAQILALTDGLLLSGGYDVHPFLFGAEPSPKLGKIHPARDAVELALIEKVDRGGARWRNNFENLQSLSVFAILLSSFSF